jgi:chemotaxis protein methyltransferase CheR
VAETMIEAESSLLHPERDLVATPVLSNQLFHQFSQLVYQQCGINLHEGKRELLQARLNKRLRATGAESYQEYYQVITSPDNQAEVIQFLDCISTNLTYFFREPKHFEFLEQLALPELLEAKRKSGNMRLRLWSAACSTGEEPYSLAMCVVQQLSEAEKREFRILATDISTRVLDIARKGLYSRDRVDKVPGWLRQKFFLRRDDGDGEPYFEVAPALKQLIAFRRLNLKERYPFSGPFDYIFCRNVMIYFDKQTQQDLIQKMATYIAPGGYLFVGHSESLTGLKHPLKYVRPSVYRK